MGNPSVPGCVLPIEELHTPGLVPPAQPAVFSGALAGNGGIGDTQLPVSLPGHVDLPVVAAATVSTRADDVEGGVESPREVGKLLPGVCVGGTVTFGGDDQLWVGCAWIQRDRSGICRIQINVFMQKKKLKDQLVVRNTVESLVN